jgi:hypothetical protein
MTRPFLENPDIYDPTIWRGLKGGIAFEPDAALVLTTAHPMIISMAPTAGRTVRLPLEANSAGLVFIILNNSAGAFALTVQNSVGGALGFGAAAIAQNQMGIAVCDGVQWRMICAAATQTSP